jgi:hypothetical protein
MTNERGERLIWLDRAAVERLRSLRGRGESFSDVIMRLAKAGVTMRGPWLAPNRISQATAASQRHFSLVKVLKRTQSQPQ